MGTTKAGNACRTDSGINLSLEVLEGTCTVTQYKHLAIYDHGTRQVLILVYGRRPLVKKKVHRSGLSFVNNVLDVLEKYWSVLYRLRAVGRTCILKSYTAEVGEMDFVAVDDDILICSSRLSGYFFL